MKREEECRAFSSSMGCDHWGPASLGESGAKRKQRALLSACRLQCNGMPVPPASPESDAEAAPLTNDYP